MKGVFLALLATALALMSSANADGGYAAPLVYGPISTGIGVFGNPGVRIGYSAKQVNNAGTLLCCKARGYKKGKEYWLVDV